MRQEDLILLGVVALAVFGISRVLVKKAGGAAPAQAAGNTYGATEIMRDNGWVYYTDGTAIGPDGKFYYQGAQVYDPKGMYQ